MFRRILQGWIGIKHSIVLVTCGNEGFLNLDLEGVYSVFSTVIYTFLHCGEKVICLVSEQVSSRRVRRWSRSWPAISGRRRPGRRTSRWSSTPPSSSSTCWDRSTRTWTIALNASRYSQMEPRTYDGLYHDGYVMVCLKLSLSEMLNPKLFMNVSEFTVNKNKKKEQKEQMLISPVPDQDRTGHLDLVPRRRIAGCPLLLAFPGGGRQDGLRAENKFHRLS